VSGFEPASPAAVMGLLNERHPRNTTFTQYFTIAYGVVDVAERELVYAAAGQPGPLRVPRRGDPVLLDSTGQPIGLLPDPDIEERRVGLEPGDRLFFFTDGLPETVGPEDEEFGRERLATVLAASRTDDLEISLDSLLDALREWSGGAPFRDDVSVLGIEVA